MKVLTFVIPAYNSAQFLDKCIPSMLVPEVLDKLEIIVVNDGSTDATAATAEKYCTQYPEVVRLISQENKGHGGALNTGCAAAKGKYLKVIDSDDWVDSQSLPRFIALLEQCSSDVVLTHHRTVDIVTGQIQDWKCYPQVFGRSYTLAQILPQWQNFKRGFLFHSITYRTEFYQSRGIQLSQHVFYEDHEFATFPCCHAQSITPLDLFVYMYRVGDTNQSVSPEKQIRQIGHFHRVIRRMAEEISTLPSQMPGKHYADIKLCALLQGYFVTSLLTYPDRKAGRQMAAEQMALCKAQAGEVYRLAKWKCRVFCLMNRLHLNKRTWERLSSSRLYRFLRREKPCR